MMSEKFCIDKFIVTAESVWLNINYFNETLGKALHSYVWDVTLITIPASPDETKRLNTVTSTWVVEVKYNMNYIEKYIIQIQ